MRHSWYLSLLLVAASCTPPEPPSRYENQALGLSDTSEIGEIIWDWAAELHHDKRLRFEQSYLYAGPFQTRIRLEFTSQAILELCPARQLLVHVVDGLLDRINSSPAAASLRPSPFTADQIEILIHFESFFGEYVDRAYIGWILLEDGMAYYYAFNLNYTDLDRWNSRNEAYFQSRIFAKLESDAEQKYILSHPIKQNSPADDFRYHPRNPIPESPHRRSPESPHGRSQV